MPNNEPYFDNQTLPLEQTSTGWYRRKYNNLGIMGMLLRKNCEVDKLMNFLKESTNRFSCIVIKDAMLTNCIIF